MGLFNKIIRKVRRAATSVLDILIISCSGMFDTKYYSAHYGVAEFLAVLDYAYSGFRSGRNPSKAFSNEKYYALYQDVAHSSMNPLGHYLRYGKYERRIYFGSDKCELFDYFFTQCLFDTEYYKATYMNKSETRILSPVEHYSLVGWKKRYKPCEVFCVEKFYEDYPDCAVNPILFLLKDRVTKLYISSPADCVKLGYYSKYYIDYINDTKQYATFDKVHPGAAEKRKIILFIVPGFDVISGGLMSICCIYKILCDIASARGYDDVIAISSPWETHSIYQYSMFDNEMPIYNYELLTNRYKIVGNILLMLPDIYVDPFCHFLKESSNAQFLKEKCVHLNIMNQNIELMPHEYIIDELNSRLHFVTQTTAHRKYCTQYFRDLYRIPLHLVLPPIENKYRELPYEEKEDLFVYSCDGNEKKANVLRSVATAFPNMRFIEIKDMPYSEYLDLISRTKWAMSFGEGLDAYFTEPYYSGGVSFCVWNEKFFTENYRDLPTIFKSYDDAVLRLSFLMRELDNKEAYESVSKRIRMIHNNDYHSDRTSQKMLEDFLDGQYDFA